VFGFQKHQMIKITRLDESLSSREAIVLETQPAFSDELLQEFVKLAEGAKELKTYSFAVKDGLFVVGAATSGNMVKFTQESSDLIKGNLALAEEAIIERKRRLKQEREEVMKEAAEVFGIPCDGPRQN
jgi:hypothetical protein